MPDSPVSHPAFAFERASGGIEAYRHTGNGLTALLLPEAAAPVAALMVTYRVGSRNEIPGFTGLSHWVEHMLFKGTHAFPRGQFDKAVARAAV